MWPFKSTLPKQQPEAKGEWVVEHACFCGNREFRNASFGLLYCIDCGNVYNSISVKNPRMVWRESKDG